MKSHEWLLLEPQTTEQFRPQNIGSNEIFQLRIRIEDLILIIFLKKDNSRTTTDLLYNVTFLINLLFASIKYNTLEAQSPLSNRIFYWNRW